MLSAVWAIFNSLPPGRANLPSRNWILANGYRRGEVCGLKKGATLRRAEANPSAAGRRWLEVPFRVRKATGSRDEGPILIFALYKIAF